MGVRKGFKRLLSIAMSLTMILSFFSTSVLAASGTDTKGHWAEKEINDWVEEGLVSGYKDGSFKPDAPITRAEFIALVNRAFKFTASSATGFNDVSPNDWYYSEVLKAKAAGYIGGYQDGTIKPKNNINRQEVAAILSRLLKVENAATVVEQFKDNENIPQWSKGVIGGIVAKGLMKGFQDGTFKPLNNTTRAEAVVILNRSLNNGSAAVQEKVFNNAGTYGPTDSSETVKGNVKVTASGVTLRNMVIEGDLTIAKEVGNGEVFLKGVTVKGKTYVNGGGENSIHFEDSVILTVVVNRLDGTVRIVASGKTTVQDVTLQTGAKLEQTSTTGATFNNVTLSEALPENSKVTLIGDFNSVEIQAAKIEVQIPKGSIKDLTVSENAQNASINLAKEAKVVSLVVDAAIKVVGSGVIEAAKVNANGTSFENKPTKSDYASGVTPSSPNSSGGSGGGGSGNGGSSTPSDTTAPTFKAEDVWVTTDDTFIVIPYSESIFGNVESLKNNVQIARNGTSFSSLDEADDVMIGTDPDHKNRLIISLSNPLTGNQTKIKVLANTIKDAAGNVQANELVTNTLAAHATEPTPDPEPTTPDSITLEYLGHSSLILTTDENKILMDPWYPGAFGLPSYSIAKEEDINLVTITHGHDDHNYDDAAPTAKSENQVFSGVIPGNFNNGFKDTFVPVNQVHGDVAFSNVLLPHFPNQSDFAMDRELTVNTGFVYNTSNMRIVHMGDAMGSILDGLTEAEITALKGDAGIDILIIPVGDWAGNVLNSTKVIAAIEALSPKVVIPIHDWGKKETAILTAVDGEFTVVNKASTISFSKADMPVPGTVIWNLAANASQVADFKNTAKTEHTADFTWTAVNGATEVKIQQSVNSGETWEDSNAGGVIDPSATSATVQGLSEYTTYIFRLVFTKGSVNSYSQPVEVTTSLGDPEGPGDPVDPADPTDSTPPSIAEVVAYDVNSSGSWDPWSGSDKFQVVFSEDLAAESRTAIVNEITSNGTITMWIGTISNGLETTWIDNKTLEIKIGTNAMIYPGEPFEIPKETIYDLNNNKPASNLSVMLTAPASFPPGFDLLSPSATTGNNEGEIILSVDLNEVGKVYYLVVENGVTAPTVDQVKAGTDFAGVSVKASGTIDVNDPTQSVEKTVAGLTSGGTYDVYFVAEDNEVSPNILNEVKNINTVLAKAAE